MKALFVAICLFAASANAALITPVAETKVFADQTTVPAGGTVNVNGQDVALTTVLAALRINITSVIIDITTPVYVVQFMVDQPAAYVKIPTTDVADVANLDALYASQNVIAVKLDFQHVVESPKLVKAFFTGFKLNGVDTGSDTIKTFLQNVKDAGDMPVDGSLTILLTKNADGTETIAYENNLGVVSSVTGAAGLNRGMLSVWLGKVNPEDKGLQLTKAALLQ